MRWNYKGYYVNIDDMYGISWVRVFLRPNANDIVVRDYKADFFNDLSFSSLCNISIGFVSLSGSGY